jgi:hypothetical protein
MHEIRLPDETREKRACGLFRGTHSWSPVLLVTVVTGPPASSLSTVRAPQLGLGVDRNRYTPSKMGVDRNRSTLSNVASPRFAEIICRHNQFSVLSVPHPCGPAAYTQFWGANSA